MKKSNGSGDRPLLISASLAAAGEAQRLQTDCAHTDQETVLREARTPPKYLKNEMKESPKQESMGRSSEYRS